MSFDPCCICSRKPRGNQSEGCLEVLGRFICDQCWGKRIFVFGSNLSGRHGKGAAFTARTKFGAEHGVGVGRTGNAYAIPTKDRFLVRLHTVLIEPYVKEFIEYATQNPDLPFFLTRVGCGLAGYVDAEIAPMFKGIPANVIAPEEWKTYL